MQLNVSRPRSSIVNTQAFFPGGDTGRHPASLASVCSCPASCCGSSLGMSKREGLIAEAHEQPIAWGKVPFMFC
jgi:hypothetical protein